MADQKKPAPAGEFKVKFESFVHQQTFETLVDPISLTNVVGPISWNGKDVQVGDKRKITYKGVNQEILKKLYDSDPVWQKHIEAPAGYKAPWSE